VYAALQTGWQPAEGRRERNRGGDGQQAPLQRGGQERPRVVGHQRDPGKPGRQQRGERPAGDRDADAVRAEIVRLARGEGPQLVIAPHALARRADSGNRPDKRVAARRSPARPENVVANAGVTQDGLPSPAMRRDPHAHAARLERTVDLEGPDVSDRTQQFGNEQITAVLPPLTQAVSRCLRREHTMLIRQIR